MTTIPAAAAVGVALVFASWQEALGALEQLLLNVATLVLVGAVTLVAVRRFWSRRGPVR